MRLKTLSISVIGALMALAVVVQPVTAVGSYFNGFETDTYDWTNVTRVPSGTNSITSNAGAYHAEADAGSYTKWGGYTNAFPANGYSTEVDVYVDMAKATGTDKRIDFSSAINKPDGTHRRDFVLSLGTNPTTPGQWLASASNNSPGWPGDPARNPAVISQSGWYTIRHDFKNVGGVLAVDVSLVNSANVAVGSWTLSDSTDVIGTTVGGNRYGWFVINTFGSSIAIDNARKTDVLAVAPATKDECKDGGWKNFQTSYKNQGQCVASVVSNGNKFNQ